MLNKNSDRNEAFTVQWARAAPIVSTYIHSLIPDYHLAEDMVQNVAIALYKKFDQYDTSRSFVAWAIGMARVEVLNSRRQLEGNVIVYQSDLPEILGGVCVEMETELQPMSYALRECLGKLAPEHVEWLKQIYVDGVRPKELARRLGKKASAVRVWLFRIRRSLAECVSQVLSEGVIK